MAHRLRETLNIYWFIIKGITNGTDKEMHKVRYGERGAELPCPLQSYHPSELHVFSYWEVLHTLSFGFLWRRHCIEMIEA